MREDALGGPIAALEDVTVRFKEKLALDGVSLAVARGSVYALLGRNGAGKSTAVACLLGWRRPDSGTAFLFGENSWKSRKTARARTAVVPESPGASTGRMFKLFSKKEEGAVVLGRALSRLPELLVLDNPRASLDAATLRNLNAQVIPELLARSATVFLVSHDPSGIDEIADQIGILKEGRLVVDEKLDSVKSRFRKITYKNEITESRTEYGSELDEFDAARVRVRGWGIEATVTDFSEDKFERFRTKDGVLDAAVSSMPFEEIFALVAVDPVPSELR